MALEGPRSVVGEVASTEVGVNGEAPEVRDPAAAVEDVEAQHTRAVPAPSLLDLDHKTPAVFRLSARPLDLVEQRIAVARANGGQVGIDVVVGRELEQEVDIVRSCPAQAEAVARDRLAHGAVATAAPRRGMRSTPEPKAVPVRISASPTIAETVIASPRSEEHTSELQSREISYAVFCLK